MGLFCLPATVAPCRASSLPAENMQGRKKNATVGLTGESVAKVVPIQDARGESRMERDRLGCDVVKVRIITQTGLLNKK